MELSYGRKQNEDLKSVYENSRPTRPAAEQAAEKVIFVIPSEARDLLFFSASKKQQIPRANSALRNDMVRVFPQTVKP
jgi:hypothetical protein